MVKILGALAVFLLGFAGTAIACEGADSAMSTPTVTTAQSGTPAPTPATAPQNNGG